MDDIVQIGSLWWIIVMHWIKFVFRSILYANIVLQVEEKFDFVSLSFKKKKKK